jgi:adenosine/AMP deaminase-like protein
MSASRLAGIPIEHVIAEIAAFPFASIAGFDLGLSDLDPRLRPGGPTLAMWRRAEAALVAGFPSFSLDEVTALRDRVWFVEGSLEPLPLHRYLRHLAHSFLRDAGPVALPCLPPTDRAEQSDPDVHGARARSAWRWLSLALPPDLILSAIGNSAYGPSRVEGLTPVLTKHLMDCGFAETHLHIGAAMDFEWYWTLTMATIGRPQVRAGAFRSPGAQWQEGAQLSAWLVRAAIGRWLLASFLRRRRQGVLDYVHDTLRPLVEDRLGVARFSTLLSVLADLESGQLSVDVEFAALQALYSRLAEPRAIEGLSGPTPLESDPIAPILDPSGSRTPEVQLVARALDYLDQCIRDRRPDPHFTALFWQVIRVRCLFYRHIVLRPLTPGLQWFVRFYDRGRAGRQGLDTRTLLESARQISGREVGLRSLEIRTAPDASRSDQQRYIETIAQISADWREPDDAGSVQPPDNPEIGLVLHFIKSRAGGIATGGPAAYWLGSNADPRTTGGPRANNPSGYRYGAYYQSQRQSAMAVEWVLRHRPLSLEVLRGFDVCTDEVAVPTWVLAPLLQRVRTAAEDGAEAFQGWFGPCPPPPRTTVHAGEDFVHLLTGMRMLDEAIEGFGLIAGDRIGHGLSLGFDPIQWATRAGMVPVAREERLFDLLWESQFYASHGGCADPSRLGLLQREIPALVETIFGPGVTPGEIEGLRADLLDPWVLYQAGFPSGPIPDAAVQEDPRIRRVISYLTDGETFERGRTSIWVETAPEAISLAALQAELRRKVGRIGLTVEVNPTSNLLIGDLNDLTRHPLWRLRPIRPSDDDTPPVPICIGSDDPLLFGSSLPLEYQSLCDAMTLAGYSEEEIRRWIDRTRASGMETRFTTQIRSHSIVEWFSQARHRPPPPI